MLLYMLQNAIMSYNDTCPDLDGLRDVLDSVGIHKVISRIS